jgi:hypothetical protein
MMAGMEVLYNGANVTDRVIEFEVPFADGPATSEIRLSMDGERDVTLMLARGQSWAESLPDTMKRGQAVALDLDGNPFSGRVLFRRLRKLVLRGRFV